MFVGFKDKGDRMASAEACALVANMTQRPKKGAYFWQWTHHDTNRASRLNLFTAANLQLSPLKLKKLMTCRILANKRPSQVGLIEIAIADTGD